MKEHDIVELIESGEEGTIVHDFNNGMFLVELLDNEIICVSESEITLIKNDIL